jgi:hypothetical protein
MTSKIGKGIKPAHTANTKYGRGDYYGSGTPAKIGKMRSGLGMQEVTPSKMKKPPKSLA